MAVTDLRYINAALTRTGFEAITTVPGNTAEGAVAAENYELLVQSILAAYPWKFATATRRLNHLADAPDLPWLHAYQRPADMLELRTVKVDGYTVDYEVMSDKILCNQDEDQTVIATFVWRVPEAQWPGWFGEAVIQSLEALFLRSPGEMYEEAEARQKSADRQMLKAQGRDAKMKTPTSPESSPTLSARGANPAARSTLEARRA